MKNRLDNCPSKAKNAEIYLLFNHCFKNLNPNSGYQSGIILLLSSLIAISPIHCVVFKASGHQILSKYM